MYIQIQMRQDHISTCISKYPISKIIIIMWISNHQNNNCNVSPFFYPRNRQRATISPFLSKKKDKWMTMQQQNISYPNQQTSTFQQNVKYSKIKYSHITKYPYQHPKKNIGYKNLPLTPIIRYTKLPLNLITWFHLKTSKKCFITMKIYFKHENVQRALTMSKQSLGLTLLETKNNPRQK